MYSIRCTVYGNTGHRSCRACTFPPPISFGIKWFVKNASSAHSYTSYKIPSDELAESLKRNKLDPLSTPSVSVPPKISFLACGGAKMQPASRGNRAPKILLRNSCGTPHHFRYFAIDSYLSPSYIWLYQPCRVIFFHSAPFLRQWRTARLQAAD